MINRRVKRKLMITSATVGIPRLSYGSVIENQTARDEPGWCELFFGFRLVLLIN